jgi:hypothetical protein
VKHAIDPGGWPGSWPDPRQRVINLTGARDPVPPEERRSRPDVDRRAHELESKVEVSEHNKTEDEPLQREERQWPQRIYYVTWPPGFAPPSRIRSADPNRAMAGFIYWQAGCWWWRPDWSAADDPNAVEMGLNETPALELEVETEEEALEHARRRVAWTAAFREAQHLAE